MFLEKNLFLTTIVTIPTAVIAMRYGRLSFAISIGTVELTNWDKGAASWIKQPGNKHNWWSYYTTVIYSSRFDLFVKKSSWYFKTK